MIKANQYIKLAWYNILRNKGYSFLCLLGTALAFIFITLILQLMRICASDYPPITNADRIIRLESFRDTEGNELGGISSFEINAFLESLNDFEQVSLYHQNGINIVANGHLHFSGVAFVNADFWKIFDFEFLYGRPFSKEDCTNRKTAVVITESMSHSYFNTGNSVGKKIEFQQREYEIIGIVKDLSIFVTPTDICTVWTPYVFDKFIPDGSYMYIVDVLVPPTMLVDEAKERTAKAVSHYFENRGKKVDFPPQKIQTMKSAMNTDLNMFQYGGFIALFLFMLIPSLNILTLSNANTNNRAEEIAVRKTFGASRISSFFLIITENLILTTVGAIVGLTLAIPVISIIQENIMQGSFMGNISLISGIDYGVIFTGILPAVIVFSLLSGGISAYLIAKRPVAQVLKGGAK
ncbi:MAG: ABC transporter permease [Prevotellaceae bacterium]|jgi:ABC-type antimicrobial peptide transport system permease subunit|nr:ABC transporter permease [Prevotellaceae bacterium]